jgi:hypothetical protein
MRLVLFKIFRRLWPVNDGNKSLLQAINIAIFLAFGGAVGAAITAKLEIDVGIASYHDQTATHYKEKATFLHDQLSMLALSQSLHKFYGAEKSDHINNIMIKVWKTSVWFFEDLHYSTLIMKLPDDVRQRFEKFHEQMVGQIRKNLTTEFSEFGESADEAKFIEENLSKFQREMLWLTYKLNYFALDQNNEEIRISNISSKIFLYIFLVQIAVSIFYHIIDYTLLSKKNEE